MSEDKQHNDRCNLECNEDPQTTVAAALEELHHFASHSPNFLGVIVDVIFEFLNTTQQYI